MGFKIARIAGIEIRMDYSFVFLVAMYGVVGLITKMPLMELGELYATLLVAYIGVVLHELGHALAARYYGVETEGITIFFLGGLAKLERIPKEPNQELAIAIAGPAVNLAIVVTAFCTGLAATYFKQEWLLGACALVILVNGIMLVFNLLPLLPMDGGRVLRSTLARWLPFVKATWISARIAQVGAVAMAVIGIIWLKNPMFLFVGGFVLLGSQAEAWSADKEQKEAERSQRFPHWDLMEDDHQ